MYFTKLSSDEKKTVQSSRQYKSTKLQLLVREFDTYGEDIMELSNWQENYKDAYCAVACLNTSFRRQKRFELHAFTRFDRVFIYNRGATKEDMQNDAH